MLKLTSQLPSSTWFVFTSSIFSCLNPDPQNGSENRLLNFVHAISPNATTCALPRKVMSNSKFGTSQVWKRQKYYISGLNRLIHSFWNYSNIIFSNRKFERIQLTGVVTSILASFVCKIIGKLASIDVTTPVQSGVEEQVQAGHTVCYLRFSQTTGNSSYTVGFGNFLSVN